VPAAGGLELKALGTVCSASVRYSPSWQRRINDRDYSVVANGHRQFENLIAVCKAFTGRLPPERSIESVRGQRGIPGSGKPNSSSTLSTQEIDDEREKLPSDTLASIAVSDREAKYLSGGGVSRAVSH
jgi:hypothetical protein